MVTMQRVLMAAAALVLAAAVVVSAAPTDEGVRVAALHHEEFELAGVLHRGVNFPDVFKFKDVSELRAQGRLASIESAPVRIRVGVRTDPTAKRFAPAILPDPTDKDTVLELAKMSYNAYENYNDTDDWFDIPGYDTSFHFGWDSDGLRGYVYANSDRSIAIMVIKGTSLTFLGIGGPTSDKDKLMDNLMFSCCCARVDERWTPVCDCYTGSGDNNVCSSQCLNDTLTNSSTSYFSIANDLLRQARQIYPMASFWLTGHSLGGSLASLLALKNDLSAFAYEAPGELLYATRLGLPVDTSDLGRYNIFHYGNLGDPIYLGTCQGRLSSCYISGYALETKCHVGNTCIYDGGVVENVNNHRISVVISRFIEPNPVPSCAPEVGCTECETWVFK